LETKERELAESGNKEAMLKEFKQGGIYVQECFEAATFKTDYQ